MKQIKIPSNIDYDQLFSKIEGKMSYKKEQIDATYVVLSFLYPSEKYITETKGFDGFKSINNEVMNKIIRNRFGKVKDRLLDVNSHSSGAILIENRKYQSGIKSMSYKLNEELFSNPGEKRVELGSNAEKRLIEYEQGGITKLEDFKLSYKFLLDQYKSNITIDSEAVNYVSTLKSLLLERVSELDGDKDEMTKRVNDTIKGMNTKIRAIQKKNFRQSVSMSNHRLNSVITNLNRELRYYLRINGNRLVEVDMKSSQPYVLGSILTDSFFNGNSSTEYNLKRIYPELYNQLNYINNKSTTDITSLIEKSIYNNKEGFPKYFMSGGLDNCQEVQSYRNSPFKGGFYQHLNSTYFKGDYDIQKIKDQIMLVLNLGDLNKRKQIELIQNFKENFPKINSFIESVNSFKSLKSACAILLQRSESYLFLRVGCKAVNEQLHEVPFLTIHDSVLIEEKDSQEVKLILEQQLHSFTGIEAGVSVKVIEDPMTILKLNLEESWNELLSKNK